MKWLQWSYLDAEKGSGGVETHMRSLARELRALGVDAQLASDPDAIFSGSWDVIHTHGSNLKIFTELKARLQRRPQGSPVWVHTLHGLTHERMLACKEFFWLGGYQAAGREVAASLSADVLLAIHPDMSLFKLLSQTSKKCAVCGNGWDPWPPEKLDEKLDEKSNEKSDEKSNEKSEIKTDLRKIPNHFWLFVGRGDDLVKGLPFLISALKEMPVMKLVAVPGSGFEKVPEVLSLGAQSPLQVRELLGLASGLILTSLHEGLALVVLEALAEGVPVVTTSVGGLKTLSPELLGLFRVDERSVEQIKKAVEQAEKLPRDPEARKVRAEHNRKFLKTWKDVAQIALGAVKEVL